MWSGGWTGSGAQFGILLQIIDRLERRKINFISLMEKFDTSSAAGRLVFHFFAALTQFERELIRERTMAGLSSARARGRLGGRKRILSVQQAKVVMTMWDSRGPYQKRHCRSLQGLSGYDRSPTASKQERSREVTALKIGKAGFTLPIELVTSTQAILARKRSGKSYTASVQAEELLLAKQQIAAIDPTGAWWGLRSSASGDGAGFPVVVFGGDHADVPLEAHAGRMLAHALVEHGFSAIFDVGLMLTDDQIRFTSDFASELLRINRTALHLYIDEADTFAPQIVESRQQKFCLGTVSRLVKQGGVRGVGVTMITQRPADINKKVLSQVDILTVLRMSHPLDIAAATGWIRSEVSLEFAREVGEALPSLPGRHRLCVLRIAWNWRAHRGAGSPDVQLGGDSSTRRAEGGAEGTSESRCAEARPRDRRIG